MQGRQEWSRRPQEERDVVSTVANRAASEGVHCFVLKAVLTNDTPVLCRMTDIIAVEMQEPTSCFAHAEVTSKTAGCIQWPITAVSVEAFDEVELVQQRAAFKYYRDIYVAEENGRWLLAGDNQELLLCTR